MKPIALAALLFSCTVMTAAHSQTVYRCGHVYSQSPCPQAVLVDVADTRSPGQQAEAQRVAQGERQLADDMRRERLADERLAKASTGSAASLSGLPPAKPVTAASQRPIHKKKHAIDKAPPRTDFIALDPSSRKRRSGA